MPSYEEKLKDPMWLKVRWFMLERDNRTCQKCGAKEEWGYTLQVHHKRYIPGREPWQYGTDDLTTLCRRCHCAEHGIEYGETKGLKHISFYLNKSIKELDNGQNQNYKA